MKREIKFRVWDNHEKKMYPALEVYIRDGHNLIEVFTGHETITVTREFLKEYTGLKDKNGTEIYEGDIVKSEDHYGELGIITFNTHNFAHIPGFHLCDKEEKSLNYWYGVSTSSESDEVIGNIYENPELIE